MEKITAKHKLSAQRKVFLQLIKELEDIANTDMLEDNPDWGDCGSAEFALENMKEILLHYNKIAITASNLAVIDRKDK